MALQEDNDTDGDVISVNGEEADVIDTDDAPKAKEDRGDDFNPDGDDAPGIEKPATEPEPKATEKPADKAPEADAEKDDHPDQRQQRIPKARFDEVNTRKNALEQLLEEAQRQIEELRQAGTPPANTVDAPPAFDEAAKEREYLEAVIDGDTDKAVQIRASINSNIRQQARQDFEVDQSSRAAATDLQSASEQAVVDFPYLDTPDGAEAIELIVASRDSKVARGMPIGEALRQAVASIAQRFMPLDTETPTATLQGGQPVKDLRPANALARGAADSNLQPPTLQTGTGNRTVAGRVNVAEMSEEQFENLSVAEKRRMRGDA